MPSDAGMIAFIYMCAVNQSGLQASLSGFPACLSLVYMVVYPASTSACIHVHAVVWGYLAPILCIFHRSSYCVIYNTFFYLCYRARVRLFVYAHCWSEYILTFIGTVVNIIMVSLRGGSLFACSLLLSLMRTC